MGIFKKRSVKDLGEKKKDMPEGLWIKCPSCDETLYEQTLHKNLRVCSVCQHHFTMSAAQRIDSLLDENTFKELFADLQSADPLDFQSYPEKVERYQSKTGLNEAVVTGEGKMDGKRVVLGVMDFNFLGASMGSVVGEKLTLAIEHATKIKAPVMIFSSSGGARMHEGIFSLMQMAKTSAALARHAKASLPYISILTHPTTGGVTASFATLGDIILAEPKCMIGFAGPRVIKETTHQDLPENFQTAEFMLEHGLIDRIVPRENMRATIIHLLSYLHQKRPTTSKPSQATAAA